jgi:quercetin dioxygenase-like cupin family protein
VRAAEVPAVPVDGSDSGICRLLVSGDRPLHLLEFEGLPTAYLDYFEHEGFELIHVTGGCVEVDIDGSFTTLGPGDSMTYSSRQPHRFRSIGPDVARLMLFETTPARAAAAQDATTAVDRRLRHVEAAP